MSMALGTSWADIASWVLLGAAGLVVLLVVIGRRAKAPHCPKCGYEVGEAADVGTRCPECGYEATRARAWRHRLRRRSLLWVAALLGVLSYGAAVTPRVATRGVYGLPPTWTLALCTVWSDPADGGTPLAAAWGFGPWRKEMNSRAGDGELMGMAGRVWAWNTERVWAKAAVKPGKCRFAWFSLRDVLRAWEPGGRWDAAARLEAMSLLMDRVSPPEWVDAGGARQEMNTAGLGLMVYAPPADLEEIRALVELLGRRGSAVVCTDADAASIALAGRVMTERVTPRADTQTMAELLEQVRGTLGCELGDNASAVVAGGTVLRKLAFVPGAGTCDEVLRRGLEAIGATPYDAEWTCEAGKLVVRDAAQLDRATLPVIYDLAALPRQGQEVPRDGVEALLNGIDTDGWRENGGERHWRRFVGARVMVFATARVHAGIAAAINQAPSAAGQAKR